MRSQRPPDPWPDQVAAALHGWVGAAGSLRIQASHRRDHMLATFDCPDQTFFVKAYDEHSVGAMFTEWDVYRRFSGLTVVPRLRHCDPHARLLVTDFVIGDRLGSLSGGPLRSAIERAPALYDRLTTGPVTAAPPHEEYVARWQQLQIHGDLNDLPAPGDVLSITSAMAALSVHGDFQPSNILVIEDGLVAVDFESYGADIPALDVARLAYNPILDLDAGERDALAAQMLDRLEGAGAPRVSRRELAACCVLWAVSCAAYFRRVLASQPDAVQHSPESRSLAIAPLQLASRLWHQEV